VIVRSTMVISGVRASWVVGAIFEAEEWLSWNVVE
jgi:hypothetical protein